MTVETLLFNGVDIQSFDIIVNDWSGLYAPGLRRGDNDVIPGRRGVLGAELPYDAYNFSIPITIFKSTHYAMLTVLNALGAALQGTNGLGTLERRLDDGAGSYVAHTAAGQFASFNSFSLLRPDTATTELSFANLDGAWFASGAPTVPIVP